MEKDPIERVRKLLYRRLRITLTDQRVVCGDFQCLDKQGNIIIGNSSEQVILPNGKTEDRHLGMVLVPHGYQTDVELEGSLAEKVQFLDLL